MGKSVKVAGILSMVIGRGEMMCIVRVVCLLFIVVTVFQASTLIVAYSNVTTHSAHVKTV